MRQCLVRVRGVAERDLQAARDEATALNTYVVSGTYLGDLTVCSFPRLVRQVTTGMQIEGTDD